MPDTPIPHPLPIDRIAPTEFNAVDRCLWRVGFARDPVMAHLRRSSPAAALGNVVHLVKRKFGDPRGFDALWDAAATDEHRKLVADWAPAVPPSPESWPGWSLARVRLRKAWLQFGSRPGGRMPTTGSSGLPPLPWRELRIEHPELPISGIPDLVEKTDGQLWVVDTKTGLRQADPSPEQRDQLLIYCGLVHANLGQMPVVAAIETARGERYSFNVDPDEVKHVLRRAVEALNFFNAEVVNGFTENLASPASDTCGWCPYRIACRPFLRAYDEDWEMSHTVLFTVQSAGGGKHGACVEGVVSLPRWRADQSFISVGFPFDTLPSAGEAWAATDYVGRGSSAVASWNTTTFRWK